MKKVRLGSIIAAFALSAVSIAMMGSENEPKKPQMPSWGVLFAPSTLGQVALKNYRGEMATYLHDNEKSAQEGVKKFWGLSDGMWQKVRAKIDADKAVNKKALYQPGNNFNTIHHPEITSHPVYNILKEECAREGTNPHSFHIGIDEIPGMLAYTQVNPMQTNAPISGMNMHFSGFIRDRAPLFLQQHAIGHEHKHLVEQHGPELDVHQYARMALEEDFNQIQHKSEILANEIKKTSWFFPSYTKIEDFTHRQSVLQQEAKEFEENCLTIADRTSRYADSAELRILAAAQEKIADTLLSCTDSNAAKNSTLSYGILDRGYPENKQDVLNVGKSWVMTGILHKKEQAMKTFEQKRQRYLVRPANQCTIL